MHMYNKVKTVAISILLLAALGVLITGATRNNEDQRVEPVPQAQVSNRAKQPIRFIENQGQWDPQVAYMARKRGMTAWLQKHGITFQFEKRTAPDQAQGITLLMTFENASDWVALTGEEQQISKHNFFIGNDRNQWRSGVPSYAQVTYQELYDDVDLRVHEAAGWLEYDLLLSEGADLSDVVICCEGVKNLEIDENGYLVMETDYGPITQQPPTAWYEASPNMKIPVACNFRLIDDQRYGFEVDHDLGLALVIDPGLEWSTFLGTNLNDEVLTATINDAGEVIIAGYTASPDFPTTQDAYDITHNGGLDGFVSCLSANGDSLLWSTYLGGSLNDILFDLALDDLGRTTVTGLTRSTDFPTTPASYDTSYNGSNDAIVTRLNSDGSQLIYSTFLGGTQDDWTLAIDLNDSGEAYVGGYTGSSDFPTTPSAYDTSYNGGQKDAFLAHLNSDGSDLIYSTLIGGSQLEGWPIQGNIVNTRVMGLAIHNSGDLIVVGYTRSTDFPATPGAYDTTYNGGVSDIFITRLNENGSSLVYSSFLGGSYEEVSFSSEIGLDTSGTVTFAGATTSPDFPTTSGAYDTDFNGYVDVVVTRLDASGSNLLYSTFMGGAGWDDVDCCILNSSDEVFITGSCEVGFPTTPNAYDTSYNAGGQDAYISRLALNGNSQSDLLYSTFLGGSMSYEWGNVLDLVTDSTVIAAGYVLSGDFPTTSGAYNPTYNGAIDGFICRFGAYVGIEEEPGQKPFEYITMSSVYPNPSYRQFNYSVSLENSQEAQISVFDITGRLVETLIDRQLPAGVHQFSWRPDENITSGTYFIELHTGGYTETRKVLLVK